MRLSAPLLMDFQKKYKEVFGESISAEKAEAELLNLAELVSITQRRTDEKEDENKYDHTRISEQ